MTSGFQCSQDGCAPIHPEPAQPSHAVSDKTSAKLKSVLADEIADIVKDGVDIPTLQQLHRFANIAQELLMVRSPLAEIRGRRRQGMAGGSLSTNPGINIGNAGMGTYQTSYGVEADDCDMSLTQEASPNETYGAKLIREIVPALSALKNGGKKSKLESLVSAIAEAKENGLDDIAEKIEAKLHDLLEKKYLAEADEGIHREAEGDQADADEPEDTKKIAIGTTPELGTQDPPEIALSSAPEVTPSIPQSPSPGAL